MAKKNTGRGREGRKRTVASLCQNCGQSFIYTSRRPSLEAMFCPVCMTGRIASRCLDVSIRLAFEVGQLEYSLRTLDKTTIDDVAKDLRKVTKSLSCIRDELAVAGGN